MSDPKDVDKQQLLMKKNQQMLLLMTVNLYASSRLIATESQHLL